MPRKRDIKQVDAVVAKYGMSEEQEWGFRDYLHELKDQGIFGTGKSGDFTFRELCKLAEEYLGQKDE